MEFPPELVALIKEFSMPTTRPDWKRLRLMDRHRFYTGLYTAQNNYPSPLLYKTLQLFLNIKTNEEFMYINWIDYIFII